MGIIPAPSGLLSFEQVLPELLGDAPPHPGSHVRWASFPLARYPNLSL